MFAECERRGGNQIEEVCAEPWRFAQQANLVINLSSIFVPLRGPFGHEVPAFRTSELEM